MKILDIPRSGSYAGVTSSKNRAGQYVRNRRSPCQPIGSGRRSFIRSAFGACSTAWSALTDAVRDSWIGYADGHPYTDRLGQSIKLTGHQMFVAINTQNLNTAVGIIPEPPVSDETEQPVLQVATNIHASTFTLNDLSVQADGFVLLSFSPQCSPGRRTNGRWWQGSVVNDAATYPLDVSALYEAEFGARAAGQKIFIKATPVNQYGVTGTPVIISSIVT